MDVTIRSCYIVPAWIVLTLDICCWALQITCKECPAPSVEKGYATGKQSRLFHGDESIGPAINDVLFQNGRGSPFETGSVFASSLIAQSGVSPVWMGQLCERAGGLEAGGKRQRGTSKVALGASLGKLWGKWNPYVWLLACSLELGKPQRQAGGARASSEFSLPTIGKILIIRDSHYVVMDWVFNNP